MPSWLIAATLIGGFGVAAAVAVWLFDRYGDTERARGALEAAQGGSDAALAEAAKRLEAQSDPLLSGPTLHDAWDKLSNDR